MGDGRRGSKKKTDRRWEARPGRSYPSSLVPYEGHVSAFIKGGGGLIHAKVEDLHEAVTKVAGGRS